MKDWPRFERFMISDRLDYFLLTSTWIRGIVCKNLDIFNTLHLYFQVSQVSHDAGGGGTLKDSAQTNQELIVEISILKKKIQELEQTSPERIREENERLHDRMNMELAERKLMEAALKNIGKRYRELSIVDDLTQLYNSRHFYHQLKSEIARSNRYGHPLTLLLFDLDNFKAFNDAYGHVEGDHVLSRLAQVVKRCLRETDFAFRYGGEEFTIILPMTTGRDGIVTAEKIRIELNKETFSPAPGQAIHMTASIGLAQYKPQEDMEAFVHRVDQLMYQGKKNGKDRVCSES
jgi:diguanylate cyclase (GGDEF)-like protein